MHAREFLPQSTTYLYDILYTLSLSFGCVIVSQLLFSHVFGFGIECVFLNGLIRKFLLEGKDTLSLEFIQEGVIFLQNVSKH